MYQNRKWQDAATLSMRAGAPDGSQNFYVMAVNTTPSVATMVIYDDSNIMSNVSSSNLTDAQRDEGLAQVSDNRVMHSVCVCLFHVHMCDWESTALFVCLFRVRMCDWESPVMFVLFVVVLCPSNI